MARESMIALRDSTSISLGDVSIEVVERVVISVEQDGPRIGGLALKRPESVVVHSPAGTSRFALDSADFGADGG
jgi:hypothetical protein